MTSTLDGRSALVTGADGFIGRHLVPRLVGAGLRVTVGLEQLPQARRDASGLEDAIPIEFDLRHAAGVQKLVAQAEADYVFHLAAVGVTDPFLSIRDALRVNLEGAINVLQASKHSARIVVARTPGERSALNVYAASKAAAWAFARMFARTEGTPVVGAMIFQCYGPGQSSRNVLPAALAAARTGADFPMSPGEQVRDWIYVDDVVDGLIAAATGAVEPGETAELGTGVGTSLGEVVGRLFETANAAGRPLLGALPYRPGEAMHVVADADRTERLTGWRASVGLDDGLRCLVSNEPSEQ